MGLALDVPGLDRFVAEIPDGALVLLSGGAEPGKNVLCDILARRSSSDGRRPAFIVSKERVAPHDQPVATRVAKGLQDVVPAGGDLFVDSFSAVALGATPESLAAGLRHVRSAALRQGGVAVLVTDQGILDARAEAVIGHLADGIIQFREREDDDGTVRYLRVPKWPDGSSHPGNIYYEVREGRLMVDTRHRVT